MTKLRTYLLALLSVFILSGTTACAYLSTADEVGAVNAALLEVDTRDAFFKLRQLPFTDSERAEFDHAADMILRRDIELRQLLTRKSIVTIAAEDEELVGIVYSIKFSVLDIKALADPYFHDLSDADQATLKAYYAYATAAYYAYETLRIQGDRTVAALNLFTMLLRLGAVV